MITPERIEAGIDKCIRRLGELSDEYAMRRDAQVDAESSFKVSYAQARMEHRLQRGEKGKPPTVPDVDDHATVATKLEWEAVEVAKAKTDIIKQAILVERSRLEGLRSLLASNRPS